MRNADRNQVVEDLVTTEENVGNCIVNFSINPFVISSLGLSWSYLMGSFKNVK